MELTRQNLGIARFISVLVVLIVLNTVNAWGSDFSIQKVEVSPLSGGVSFNTVTLGSGTNYRSWVTASSVIGRKEVLILNTSTTDNIFITGVSGSSVYGTIYPRESVTFKASSSLNLYVSANTVVSCQIWEIR